MQVEIDLMIGTFVFQVVSSLITYELVLIQIHNRKQTSYMSTFSTTSIMSNNYTMMSLYSKGNDSIWQICLLIQNYYIYGLGIKLDLACSYVLFNNYWWNPQCVQNSPSQIPLPTYFYCKLVLLCSGLTGRKCQCNHKHVTLKLKSNIPRPRLHFRLIIYYV